MNYFHMDSPIGRLLLAADDTALCDISFERSRHRRAPDPEWIEGENGIIAQTRLQLSEYFAGTRQQFSIPLRATGTVFQQRVWSELCNVPFGSLATYRDIAERIGRPTALRAVGSANGRNPIPIIIPCHRIIGSNGALTGFGGGVDVKAALLELENRQLALRFG